MAARRSSLQFDDLLAIRRVRSDGGIVAPEPETRIYAREQLLDRLFVHLAADLAGIQPKVLAGDQRRAGIPPARYPSPFRRADNFPIERDGGFQIGLIEDLKSVLAKVPAGDEAGRELTPPVQAPLEDARLERRQGLIPAAFFRDRQQGLEQLD